MKIAVAGTGYVGLSMATLLAQHHSVMAVDVVAEKVEKINRRESPIQDEYIERYFAEKELVGKPSEFRRLGATAFLAPCAKCRRYADHVRTIIRIYDF